MAAQELVPRWVLLPPAAVSVSLVALGLSGRTTGAGSVAFVSLGALYGFGAGMFLYRPRRPRLGRSMSQLLLAALLKPLLVPPLRSVMWVAARGYLSQFKRRHRGLMQPDEQPLLMLREKAEDGDVWVLSDQALYFGRKSPTAGWAVALHGRTS